jgi:hypothetical protein
MAKFVRQMVAPVNIAHFIADLLFRHDCVIVPGLGGFVSTYAGAKIHPVQHTFLPPSKQIVFNKHLQQNDGLLVNAIAVAMSISFDEAQTTVKAFTEALQNQLQEGKKVELLNLGSMWLDPEKNICFESDPGVNFLMESFGLAAFQTMPILRETPKTEPKPVVREDRKITTAPEEGIAPRVRRSKAVYVAAAIALPILIALTWVGLQIQDNGQGIAGLGFFKQEPGKYSPVNYVDQTKVDTAREDLKFDAAGNADLQLLETGPRLHVNVYKMAADSTSVAASQNLAANQTGNLERDRFYIIAGCFRMPENADNYYRELSAKGLKPSKLNAIKGGMTYISLGTFAERKAAEDLLFSVRGTVPEAWLMKR